MAKKKPRKVWRADVTIHATAYVIAPNEASARRMLRRIALLSPNLKSSDGSVPISSAPMDSQSLPKISLSPAMTIDEDTGRSGTKVELAT